MKYNTVCIEITVPLSEDGYVFDVGSLYDRFHQLTDKRKARGKRYALSLVLVLLVSAKLSGEDYAYGIAHWGRGRQSILCEVLPVGRQTLPSHNTYRRVLGDAIEPVELQAVVTEFLTQSPETGQSVLVALDGKTLRGSIPAGQTQGMHLLAAYLPSEGIVLMQVAVESKENEISAAPRVLKSIDLRGKIVSGDALLTQRDLSTRIVEAGGEYVWQVKDNQPQLREDIEYLFQPESCVPGFSPVPKDFQTAQTVDNGHGRLETRTLTTSSLLREYADWPYLEQVFKLERHTTHLKKGQAGCEVVYGITSLKPEEAEPRRLLEIVRGYWGIENGLRYRRDKTLREDATRMTKPTLAEAMAIINNLIVGLTAQQGWRNLPQARRHYNACLQDALSLVTPSYLTLEKPYHQAYFAVRKS
jgi:predicted transposase YbfD/YdcC